ncbi:MAG TPA: DUF6580 family putative transport protein [Terracidiphilus sp.]|jgi:hypothetical protein
MNCDFASRCRLKGLPFKAETLRPIPIEVVMVAYLLLLVAVLSRVIPHAGLWNFTAVTGGLVYFGARRPWREMVIPVAVLAATDPFLTIAVYHSSFRWQSYVITWIWYVAAMALGFILLHNKTTFARGAAGALLGPTGFFLVSNYGVWASGFNGYPHTFAGLGVCYVAGLPFYGNDLASTAIVLGAALGVPALVRKMRTPVTGSTQGAV